MRWARLESSLLNKSIAKVAPDFSRIAPQDHSVVGCHWTQVEKGSLNGSVELSHRPACTSTTERGQCIYIFLCKDMLQVCPTTFSRVRLEYFADLDIRSDGGSDVGGFADLIDPRLFSPFSSHVPLR